MKNVLVVTSSAHGPASVSSRLAGDYVDRLRAAYPDIDVVRRDVGRDPLPHLVEETVAGIRAVAETEAEQRTRALSDQLIAELQAADIIVIGAPMYNFGMSSTLKTWFDHVLRARVTFRYTEDGPEGLIKGKKAIVIESRAGLYSQGDGAAADFQEPHIRLLLGFMGIEDVTFVRAERLAFPDMAEASVAGAREELAQLAGARLLAAA